MAFLDEKGLAYFWQQILAKINTVKITKTSQLTNDSNYITSADIPVKSVAGKTGAVTLSASDVGAVPTTRTVNGKALSANISLTASDVEALPSTTSIPSATSDLINDSGYAVIHFGTGLPVNPSVGDFWFIYSAGSGSGSVNK